jgi:hypothetical protein
MFIFLIPVIGIHISIIAGTWNKKRAIAAGKRIILNAGRSHPFKSHLIKSNTVLERTINNTRHAVWDIDAAQAIAVFEHIATDARHTVSYGDSGKPRTIFERSFTDTCHTIRDVDASQASALIERSFTNIRHTVWNVDAGQAIADIERIVVNARQSISYSDGDKSRTPIECRLANTRYTIRDVDAGQVIAMIESIFANARHTISKDYRGNIVPPRTNLKRTIIRHFASTAASVSDGQVCPRQTPYETVTTRAISPRLVAHHAHEHEEQK